MRPAWVTLGPLLLAACDRRAAVGTSAPTTGAPAPPTAATAPASPPDASSSLPANASAADPASASPSPPPSSGLLHHEVEAEEIRCGKDPHERCVCAAPLGCGGGGKPCITLKENLAAFRQALAGKDGRMVMCNHAETGTCGAYRYFYFDGDVYRTELRFFTKEGAFVGEVAVTDYDEYCDSRAGKRVRGTIPACPSFERTELICGKPRDFTGLVRPLFPR